MIPFLLPTTKIRKAEMEYNKNLKLGLIYAIPGSVETKINEREFGALI
jgi:hypothetical protein